MFSEREVKFLQRELGNFVSKTQQRLEDQEVKDELRQKVEARLITVVSILNKLQHLNPEKIVDLSKAKMLIVDDVETMRKVHRHYFMECGFKNVDLAADGHQALKLMLGAWANDEPYELVVSDWEMPKMSGLELLKEVRMDKNLWKTPFYLISGLSDKKHIVKALNLGADGYMVKPVNMALIKEKFKEYFEA